VNPTNFFAELRRRNVYKVAIVYAVIAWLLMQIASQIFPFFQIPNWAVRLVVLLLILGFPIALVLAWAFELTPGGLRRTDVADALRKRPDGAFPPKKSIAVLPFENLSRDPDNAYFAEGIQQEILTLLAKIADLKVISRTSTQRYQSKPGNLAEIATRPIQIELAILDNERNLVRSAGNADRIRLRTRIELVAEDVGCG
jgi:hypothetical protein